MSTKYEDLSDDQKAAAWDQYHGLSTHEWLLHKCSDCDPEFAQESDDPGAEYEGQGPALIVCVKGGKPDYCHRCGSYLSLDEGTPVFVTTRNPQQS